ncbi:MHCKB [Hepatospora eriocheir]|uniref:MHCKB n=1 Tax=Hepatospora eriocheir TaxID=1081669 RepID=A0A1X0QFU0_9MICR|nr:MHCKB [Hepatospora eriocheir]
MDSKICVFDFKGNLIDQIKKQRLGISSFVVKNDLIFSGARDGSVIVLSYERECFKVIAEFGSLNSITAMCVSDRHVMFGDSKGKICVYCLKTYKKVCELKKYPSKINVMVNNAKYLISGDDDGNVIVFNLDDFSICYRLKHKREVISISISPDELSFATGGFDKAVQIWNLSKGSNLGKYFHVRPVYKIMYYDDLIISCSKDKMIRMF